MTKQGLRGHLFPLAQLSSRERFRAEVVSAYSATFGDQGPRAVSGVDAVATIQDATTWRHVEPTLYALL